VQTKEIKYEEEPEQDPDQIRFHAGVVFLPLDSAPGDMQLHRDNADFMNNFYVYIVATTFTDIERVIKDFQNKNNDEQYRAALKELEIVKRQWQTIIVGDVKQ